MKEVKISGKIGGVSQQDSDYRNVIADCGGVVLVRDFILRDCGEYSEGDRITITINSCGEDECYYPPKPTATKV